MRVGVLCLAVILVACGKAAQTASVSPTPAAVTASTTADSPSPVPSDSPSAASSARTIPPPSPCSPSAWPTYKDSTYKFTVSYPPCFTFEQLHGSAGTGLVMTYRAFDPVYKDTYPAGQLEIAIYTKDASTLSGWLTKHSGPVGSKDMTRYWTPTTNQSPVTVDGKPGLAFDWVPDQLTPTVHATATFLGTSYVLTVEWWSTDPSYATTMQPYYQKMLGSLTT